MMRGADLSHYNTDVLFNRLLASEDFIILKATEGKTYSDPCFKARQKKLTEKDKPRGYYHYARPENNNYKFEVDNFLNTVGDDAKNSILILDWEGNALTRPFSWALEWCREVENSTGCTPIIYASASFIKLHKSEYKHWWTAHYKDACKDGCEHDGVDEVMTQYTSTPYDVDIFHGTLSDWQQFTAKKDTKCEIIAHWVENGFDYYVERVKR